MLAYNNHYDLDALRNFPMVGDISAFLDANCTSFRVEKWHDDSLCLSAVGGVRPCQASISLLKNGDIRVIGCCHEEKIITGTKLNSVVRQTLCVTTDAGVTSTVELVITTKTKGSTFAEQCWDRLKIYQLVGPTRSYGRVTDYRAQFCINADNCAKLLCQ